MFQRIRRYLKILEIIKLKNSANMTVQGDKMTHKIFSIFSKWIIKKNN